MWPSTGLVDQVAHVNIIGLWRVTQLVGMTVNGLIDQVEVAASCCGSPNL
jgi:hypothetical protein